MDQTYPEWKEEQARVDYVVREISLRIHELEKKARNIQSDIIDIRRDFWEDVTVNLEDSVEAAETMASIRQQAEVLSEQERSHQGAAKLLKTLYRLKDSPYFGRIDFRGESEKESQPVYLGISSFVDKDRENFLVYDWRAPISSVYYDFAPGPAEYTAPAGTIRGELELKRQYLIKGSDIYSVFDTGITIGDELLQEVLGNLSDTHMRSIVATIQQEQNRIIRDTRSRLLVVQGAAGSGKTSAALQRVAFLLYHFRESLNSKNIVLFSPNPLFASYVSTVLPELGEENVRQITFQEYLEAPVGRAYKLEDMYDQLEYVLTASGDPGYEARVSGIQYKAGLAFKEWIDQYIDALGKNGMNFRGIKFRGKLLISGKQLKRQFYSCHEGMSIPNRLRQLVEWTLNELKVHEIKEQNARWVEEEIELLDEETYAKAFRTLQGRNHFGGERFDDYASEKQFLSRYVVHSHFKRLRSAIKRLRFMDIPALFRQLFTISASSGPVWFPALTSLPENWQAICEQTVARLDNGILSYEDATPYVYLKERILGTRRNAAIRYVFIDEAQDYSPFQFACLKQLFPHGRMTVLGDINQTIHVQAAEGSGFASLYNFFPADQTETIFLRRSYRSTRQIIEFTSGIVPEGKLIEPFHRDGQKPTLTEVENDAALEEAIVQQVQLMQSRGLGTIAIICKTEKESQKAYSRLLEKIDVKRISKMTTSYLKGVLVIPSYLAKGVEFDGVILYDASKKQYCQEHERRLFYTACTRAMHELHLFTLGERSPFLDDVPLDTYVQS